MRFSADDRGLLVKLIDVFFRVRGYQYKAEGPGEAKKNAVAFKHALNDGKEKLAEAAPPAGDVNAGELEVKGFAEKDEE